MDFFQIYLNGLLLVVFLVTLLWLLSVYLKNVSIVDAFWGCGFVILAIYYFFATSDGELHPRKVLLLVLAGIWGLRLSIYLSIRNWGKPEDFRYQKFRKDYGVHRYWWFSFFQVFLLQGFLLWIISAPLLSVPYFSSGKQLNALDYIAVIIWVIGFLFEAVGDYQLSKFKANPSNKNKVLNTGLWEFTRHPNYFGDATIWWSFGIFSVAAGSYLPLIGCFIMNLLLLKVSGVVLLERTLTSSKPGYKEYMEQTSAFFPWFPKVNRK